MTFYQVYPDSRHRFDDNFKQEICNVIYEWVIGIKPIPESYHAWEINDELDFRTNKTVVKVSSNVESKFALAHILHIYS